jgi:ferric-dicitrate binding protein FerR (iron transport regulator)
MDEKVFRELLEKYALGNCTRAEEALLFQWYDAFQVTEQKPVSGEAEYQLLEKQIRLYIQEYTTPKPATAAREVALAGWWRRGWVRAACILLLAGSAVWWWQAAVHKPAAVVTAWNTISTRKGERHRVLLPDSSVLYVDGGSVLQYPAVFTGAERQVKLLAGEVFLAVHANRQQPFAVYTAGLQVKVLGTSFMVRNRQQDTAVTVAVKTGKVALHAPGGGQLSLTAAVAGVYGKQSQNLLQTRCNTRAISGWVNNELFFEDATLETITDVLANSYGMQCFIATEALQQKRFKAGFVHRTPEDILRVLSKTGDFHYTIKDSVISIYP